MKSTPRKTILTHLGDLVAWTSFGIVLAAIVMLVGVPLVVLLLRELFWGLKSSQEPAPTRAILEAERIALSRWGLHEKWQREGGKA